MIVGASVLQLPAIQKAKEMGLEVAVVDYNPKAVGIECADKYYNASTIDEEAVLAAALDFRPDGIMTLATDMPMRSVARVAETLKLPGISYDTAVRATDKYEMIKAFKTFNVPSPWFFVVDAKEELECIKDNLSFPCIIKPTDNAGSHGVGKVDSYDELIEKFEYSKSNSRGGKVIIEEFLEGPEVSVEMIVQNGKMEVLQITDKITTNAPYFVEMGHSQPSSLSKEIQYAIKDVAIRACEAVGINSGPAHVEMKITPRGPVMIELGARMGGDNITTHLVPLSTGIDMVKATIDVALGRNPDISPKFEKASAIRYITAPLGIIESIQGIDKALNLESIKQITLVKDKGEESGEIKSSNDRIGFVIAQGENVKEAIKSCENALKTIIIKVN